MSVPPDPNAPPPDNTAQPKPPNQNMPTGGKVTGDVNRVTIGEGAQVDQIAVGRNIFQSKITIGSLVIPVRFLLVLLLVAAVLAVAVWWITTPSQMAGGAAASNVAIVQFGQEDANGNVTDSAQGTYLSDWLYNRLNSELEDMDAADRPAVWHLATGFDPVHLFQKRTTALVRTEADAERVAKQVNASIVIYGNLVPGQSAASFVPKFYVEQRKGEADELSGTQQLGQPIPMPTPVNDEYLRANLQPIGRALVWFSRGLQNDLNGRYDLAYRVLKEGEAALADWDENQGKEVLYYFIGREALFVANCEQDAALIFDTPGVEETAVEQALNDANNYFQRAQNVAKRNGRTYARATFGLGQVVFQRAQRYLIPAGSENAGQCRINVPDANRPCPQRTSPVADPVLIQNARTELGRAQALLKQAHEELPEPAPSRLESKINGAIASADILAGQLLLLEQKPADAGPLFQSAASALQGLTQTTSDDPRTLAALFLSLGVAQSFNGTAHLMQQDTAVAKTEFQSALDTYAACIKLIPTDTLDVFLRSNVLPNCTCAQRGTQDILDTMK